MDGEASASLEARLEPDSPGTAPFPGLWQGAGIALVYLALSAWLDTLMALTAEGLHWPPWIALLPGLLLGFPLALAFGLWIGRLDVWDILSLRRVRPGLWPPLLLTHAGFLVLILAFAHGVETGLDQFLPTPLKQSLLANGKPLAGASPLLLGVLLAGAAIPEEILFRGLILRGLLGRYRPMAAVWMSAALFMVAHGNPLQFPVAIMLGACTGWYYQRTGSLWPGLAAHALHNLGAGLSTDPSAAARDSLVVTILPPWSWILAAPLASSLGLLWLRWIFHRPEPGTSGVLGLR